MASTENKVLCKNIFKNIDKEDAKKAFTGKWVEIICRLEQSLQRA